MPQDNRTNTPGAKLDQTEAISDNFNEKNALAEKIAASSEEAREKCKMLQGLAGETRDQERKSQQRSHQFRVNVEKIKSMENYIMNPADRPAEVEADPTQDLKEIHDQAERSVTQKEAYYLSNIDRQLKNNIRQVLKNDKHGHEAGHSDHQQEHEH